MAWLGFINLYMTRINVSVIIVAMVKRNSSSSTVAPCLVADNSLNESVESPTFDLTTQSPSGASLVDTEGDLMDWDETTQGLILGSFFYGYFLTQIPGGRFAEMYGTKWVFGLCIFGGGICALLSPVAARLHYGAFIFVRVIHGLLQGVSWPSMHACLAQWIPPFERPRFIGTVYFGTNLSTAMTLPICGLIIDRYGWPAAFYWTGSLSLVWCLFWFSLMHSYPSEHPRISSKELEYIELAIKQSGTSMEDDQPKSIPWRSILTSVPMLAMMTADFGNNWAIGLFYTQLPTYMKNILGFSIKENGLISALPFISRYAGAVIMSIIGDWLLTHKYLSIRSTRRIFSTIAMWIPAIMLLGVAYVGCNWKAIVVMFCTGLFFNGAVATSTLVNPADIAPNYSGTLFGLSNMTSTIASFVVPVVTGVMTDGQQTLEQWRKVFWICVPMYIVMHIVFFIFVSGDVQPWNFAPRQELPDKRYSSKDCVEEKEIATLN
ncbi:sialin-like isoform X2 [Macrobrachium nipponense]